MNEGRSFAQFVFAFADVLIWVSLAVLMWGLFHFVMHMPFWNVREIKITRPLTYARAEDLAKVLPATLKGNFFSVNLNEIREALLKMPWVKEIKIARQFPRSLTIEIVEQKALAQWGNHSSKEKALVNEEGEIFYVPLDYPFPPNLPQFFGPEGTSFELSKNYRLFSKILSKMEQKIMQVYLSPRLSWEMRLENGVVLKLGRYSEKIKPEENLNRFVKFYPLLQNEFSNLGVLPKIIDLRYVRGLSWQ